MAITVGTNGWCTLAAAHARIAQFSSIITAGAGPITDTIFESMITARFHEINGYIRNVGLTVAGITADSDATAQLALANALLAAADVLDAFNAGAKGQRNPVAENYELQARRIIDAVKDGAVDLGALSTTRETAPTSSRWTEGETAVGEDITYETVL